MLSRFSISRCCCEDESTPTDHVQCERCRSPLEANWPYESYEIDMKDGWLFNRECDQCEEFQNTSIIVDHQPSLNLGCRWQYVSETACQVCDDGLTYNLGLFLDIFPVTPDGGTLSFFLTFGVEFPSPPQCPFIRWKTLNFSNIQCQVVGDQWRTLTFVQESNWNVPGCTKLATPDLRIRAV